MPVCELGLRDEKHGTERWTNSVATFPIRTSAAPGSCVSFWSHFGDEIDTCALEPLRGRPPLVFPMSMEFDEDEQLEEEDLYLDGADPDDEPVWDEYGGPGEPDGEPG